MFFVPHPSPSLTILPSSIGPRLFQVQIDRYSNVARKH